MVAYTKPQQRKKEESEELRGKRDQIKLSCRIQESKRKVRRSINCMLLGSMMICEIEFVKYAVKFGKGVNELIYW